MREITKEQLAEILEKHRLWLMDDGGERANLRYADLSSADLRSANLSYADLRSADLSSADLRSVDLSSADLNELKLCGATGNMGEIKSIALDTYPIAYTADYLQIGCERHAITEWWGFTDSKIKSMDSGALAWWRIWKPVLQQIIEISPAKKSERKTQAAA